MRNFTRMVCLDPVRGWGIREDYRYCPKPTGPYLTPTGSSFLGWRRRSAGKDKTAKNGD